MLHLNRNNVKEKKILKICLSDVFLRKLIFFRNLRKNTGK